MNNAEQKNRYDAITKRFQKMKSVRANWESLWNIIAHRVDPKYVGHIWRGQTHNPGQIDLGRQNFDMTISRAIPAWAAIVSALTTPKTEKWHNISVNNKYFNDKYTDWLEDARDILFARRYAVSAKFSNANRESLMLTGTYGGAAVSLMRPYGAKKGNYYKTWPLKEWYVDQNFQGDTDTFHREYILDKRQLLQEFDEELFPQSFLKDAKMDKEFTIHCAVYPNEYWDSECYNPKYKRNAVVFSLKEINEIILEGGSDIRPVNYQRYDVLPTINDPYPYSPVMLALCDQAMLNQANRAIANSADKSINPLILGANEDIINPRQLRGNTFLPGSVSADGRPLVQAMQFPSNIPYTLEMIRMYADNIKEIYGLHMFEMLMRNPNMTATQVLQQSHMQGIVMSPFTERRESEFLGPLIEMELYQAHLDGDLAPMPPELAQAIINGEAEIKIEYESPIRRAQQAQDITAIVETVNTANMLAPFNPSIKNKLNTEKMLDIVARARGANTSEIFNPPELVEELNARDVQSAAQAAQIQGAAEAAKITKDMASARQSAGGDITEGL